MDDNDTGHKAGDRIAKVIARAGLASRREAEAWIAAGRVAVNGALVTSPALNVTESDHIVVDGEPLPQRERTRLFLYNKPRGLMTTHADPQGRPTIFQRLPAGLPRLISVGRLDFNTEGLLLLTNDGALARVLELPSTGWLRRYRVRAHGSVTPTQLVELSKGVTISGIHYGAIDASIERVQGSNLWLSFAIREGKNREVRTVLGHLGLDVTRLIRVSFGPFQLAALAEGAAEEVRTRVLREQLGAKLVALAGVDFSAPVKPRPAPAKPDRRETPQQTPVHHAWRPREEERPNKKLKRKYHGARNDEERRQTPAGKARTGALKDRKGRMIPIERHGEPPKREEPLKRHESRGDFSKRKERPSRTIGQKSHGDRDDVKQRRYGETPKLRESRDDAAKREQPQDRKHSRRRSFDRSSGPRPRNPRSR
jgi:23S rRNA pseudouridine2605 synthase